jgi:small redox-active disulfide protein 2
MNIKVLGSGCPSCIKLEKHTKIAVEQLELDATIEKVTDMKDIMSYNVMSTPALVIDGKVVSAGKVLSPKDIIKLIG